MRQARAFWCCAGDIVATGGHVLASSEARRLRDLYLQAARTLAVGAEVRASALAARLAAEVTEALDAASRWRQAASAL